jgi:hypothetical protein
VLGRRRAERARAPRAEGAAEKQADGGARVPRRAGGRSVAEELADPVPHHACTCGARPRGRCGKARLFFATRGSGRFSKRSAEEDFSATAISDTVDRVWSGYPRILGTWVVGLVEIFTH